MEDIGEVATAAAGVVLDSVSALGGVLLAVGCFPASIVCLKVRTNCSANPLEEGWYGAHRKCLTPLAWVNAANSAEVN